MVEKLGGILIPLPDKLLTFFNAIAWNLHLWFLSEFPNPAMNMLRYPWVVNSDKLKRQLGFTYKYTTCKAFDDYADFVRRCKGN
jgi:UDP-glucose 4-epimerase